nr:DNA-processing protein DprA [Vibrio anguillarum]
IKAEPEVISKDSFYLLFVQYLQTVASEPISEAELVEASELHKGQVKSWLSLALEQNLITKLTRPIRYQWIDED